MRHLFTDSRFGIVGRQASRMSAVLPALALLLTFSISPARGQEGPDAIMSLLPAAGAFEVGETIQFTVSVDTLGNLTNGGVSAAVWDPNVLSLVGGAGGFTIDGGSPWPDLFEPRVGSGYFELGFMNLSNIGNQVSYSGPVFHFEFEAVAPAENTAVLLVTEDEAGGFPSITNGSGLSGLDELAVVDSLLTIIPEPTPTPTPTPTPEPTPTPTPTPEPTPTPTPTPEPTPTPTPTPEPTPTPTPTPEPTPTPTPWRLMGDFNNDGCVDFEDFIILLENWGQPWEGIVMGFDDFINLLENWGEGPNCPPGPTPTPTPEPTPTPTPWRAIGDFNNDGCVDFADFVLLLENWGEPWEGIVMDFNDFVALLENWGEGPNCP